VRRLGVDDAYRRSRTVIRKNALTTIAIVLFCAFGSSLAFAGTGGEACIYVLDLSGSETGEATARVQEGGVGIQIDGGEPNSLYTVWVDFTSRATGELPADYPEEGLDRGVAPAFASTAPVFAGMGIDPNGMITDENGDARAIFLLDYNVLAVGDSPLVHENLSMHGLNRVGGFWVRQYPVDPELEASLQTTDPDTGLPLLARATPAGITIVRHPDLVTHGHTPGVGDVDHFSSFKGDFPEECLTARAR